MAWVRLDDQFPDHPKVMAAGPAAAWLFVCGLTYCSRLLTDGFIPASQVRKLADLNGTDRLADRLIEVGLWDRADGGYRVHDYLEYQQSADKVRGERRAAQERMQRRRSENVRPNFARSSLSTLHPINNVVSNETTTPPNPPQSNGVASAPSTYINAINRTFSEISADFTKLDPELSATWLRKTLGTAEIRAGPLAPEQIVGGLELAILQIERAMASTSTEYRINNIRGFATKAVTEALEEQAHEVQR